MSLSSPSRMAQKQLSELHQLMRGGEFAAPIPTPPQAANRPIPVHPQSPTRQYNKYTYEPAPSLTSSNTAPHTPHRSPTRPSTSDALAGVYSEVSWRNEEDETTTFNKQNGKNNNNHNHSNIETMITHEPLSSLPSSSSSSSSHHPYGPPLPPPLSYPDYHGPPKLSSTQASSQTQQPQQLHPPMHHQPLVQSLQQQLASQMAADAELQQSLRDFSNSLGRQVGGGGAPSSSFAQPSSTVSSAPISVAGTSSSSSMFHRFESHPIASYSAGENSVQSSSAPSPNFTSVSFATNMSPSIATTSNFAPLSAASAAAIANGVPVPPSVAPPATIPAGTIAPQPSYSSHTTRHLVDVEFARHEAALAHARQRLESMGLGIKTRPSMPVPYSQNEIISTTSSVVDSIAPSESSSQFSAAGPNSSYQRQQQQQYQYQHHHQQPTLPSQPSSYQQHHVPSHTAYDAIPPPMATTLNDSLELTSSGEDDDDTDVDVHGDVDDAAGSGTVSSGPSRRPPTRSNRTSTTSSSSRPSSARPASTTRTTMSKTVTNGGGTTTRPGGRSIPSTNGTTTTTTSTSRSNKKSSNTFGSSRTTTATNPSSTNKVLSKKSTSRPSSTISHSPNPHRRPSSSPSKAAGGDVGDSMLVSHDDATLLATPDDISLLWAERYKTLLNKNLTLTKKNKELHLRTQAMSGTIHELQHTLTELQVSKDELEDLVRVKDEKLTTCKSVLRSERESTSYQLSKHQHASEIVQVNELNKLRTEYETQLETLERSVLEGKRRSKHLQMVNGSIQRQLDTKMIEWEASQKASTEMIQQLETSLSTTTSQLTQTVNKLTKLQHTLEQRTDELRTMELTHEHMKQLELELRSQNSNSILEGSSLRQTLRELEAWSEGMLKQYEGTIEALMKEIQNIKGNKDQERMKKKIANESEGAPSLSSSSQQQQIREQSSYSSSSSSPRPSPFRRSHAGSIPNDTFVETSHEPIHLSPSSQPQPPPSVPSSSRHERPAVRFAEEFDDHRAVTGANGDGVALNPTPLPTTTTVTSTTTTSTVASSSSSTAPLTPTGPMHLSTMLRATIDQIDQYEQQTKPISIVHNRGHTPAYIHATKKDEDDRPPAPLQPAPAPSSSAAPPVPFRSYPPSSSDSSLGGVPSAVGSSLTELQEKLQKLQAKARQL